MNRNQNAPFRADVVGSFLRPKVLKRARQQFIDQQISVEELKLVEDRCIAQLVEQEKKAGLKSATDGEFRRSYWHLDFFGGLLGVEHNVMPQGYLFHGEETRADSARLCGKVRFNPEHPFFEHFRFLEQIVDEDIVPRQTIPAPAQFYAELTRGENEKYIELYYPDKEELFQDISKAYHETIYTFYQLGCRNIQLDDCTWGMLCDKSFWKTMTNGEYDVRELQELYLRLNNETIKDLPDDLVVNSHICRGNYHSTWATSGGYDPVAETLFGRENVNAYYLEFDTERAGGFEPLQYVHENQKVVLGLITSKYADLENQEHVIERIYQAAKYIPLERLYLSPQCGFASTEEGNILTEEEQWRKIALVCEIAEKVWK